MSQEEPEPAGDMVDMVLRGGCRFEVVTGWGPFKVGDQGGVIKVKANGNIQVRVDGKTSKSWVMANQADRLRKIPGEAAPEVQSTWDPTLKTYTQEAPTEPKRVAPTFKLNDKVKVVEPINMGRMRLIPAGVKGTIEDAGDILMIEFIRDLKLFPVSKKGLDRYAWIFADYLMLPAADAFGLAVDT